MKKILKYGAFTLAGLLVVILIVVAVVVVTFNPNDYKPLIVKLVQDKKQRTLNIEGDIKLAFWPKIGANLGKISLSEHKSDKEFASVEGLKVSLALLPLLKKELIVDTIYVDGARVNIVRYEDGTTNFDDLLSDDESKSEQIKFDVDGIIVSNSAVSYTDLQGGNEFQFSKFNLKTGHVALGEPFDLATDFELVAAKQELKLAAKIEGNFMANPEEKHFVVKGLDANVQGDFAGGTDVVIKLSGDVDAKPENTELLVDGLKLDMTGNFDGSKIAVDLVAPKLVVLKDEVSGKEAKLSLTQEKGSDTVKANMVLADIKGSPKALQSSGITGDISAKQGARTVQGKFSSPFSGNIEQLIFELPKLAGSLDVKDPALPNGAMKGDFALKLYADVKQEQVRSDFNLAIDNAKLNGDVAVASFSKPNIKFNLNADTLDLNKLLGKSSSQPAKSSTAASKPTDLSALKNLLVEGKVTIGNVIYDKYRLSGINLGIKADGERLNVNPFAMKFDDSQIKGSFGISRFAKPVYHFDVDIDKLDADRYISKTESKTSAPTTKSDPNAPIDLSALKALNADGSLRIGNL
ncbi:MAG: AsmA family protein, partial [Nitrosomonadales bacterium]|nr:AsmA family protein [Nitrosomonadales bacterium]